MLIFSVSFQVLRMLPEENPNGRVAGKSSRDPKFKEAFTIRFWHHTVYGKVASCIPDEQRFPAPPVNTTTFSLRPVRMYSCDFIKGHQARVLPCLGLLVTVAMLAQGKKWAVAVTQAFFENGQRQSVILHR